MGQTASCLKGSGVALDEGDYIKDPGTASGLPSQHGKHFAGQIPKHIGVFEDAQGAKQQPPALQQQQRLDVSPAGPAAAVETNSSKQQVQEQHQTSSRSGKAGYKDFNPHTTLDESLGHPEAPNMPHNPHQHGPPRPPCEDQRLAAADEVTRYLDAAPKKELENILHLVCNIFKVENALIALFGDRRIYILNTIGGFKAGDFPWRWSFCGWTMASEQHTVMVINDALQDARFADNKYVQEIGVRFYCGSPLVSSTGHRLGTLCFADTQPRVFDTSSLQILANFSELVTRELEKDIALARQQQQQREAAVVDRQQQYDLLLRTVDCVTSAVLLVDTSKQGWPIIHANSGWERLHKQCCQQQLLPGWRRGSSGSSSSSTAASSRSSRHLGYLEEEPTNAAAGSSGSSNAGISDSSKPLNCCFADVTTPLMPTPEDTSSHGSSQIGAGAAAASDNISSSSSSSSIIGLSLWSLVDPLLLQQISGGSSSGSGSLISRSNSGIPNAGVDYSPGDQVIEQVKGRQSFTLRGVKLASAFGAASAQLTFRCAGFSMLEGAPICLPAFCPDTSELAAAAAALSANNPSHTTITPTVAPGDSLYFVTVKLHQGPRSSSGSVSSSLRTSNSTNVSSILSSNQSLGCMNPSCGLPALSLPGNAAGTAASSSSGSSSSGLTVEPCMFPQFTGSSVDTDYSDQQQQQGFVLEPLSAATSSSVKPPSDLVVISAVTQLPNAKNNSRPNSQSSSQTNSQSSSFDLAIQGSSESFSSSKCGGFGGDGSSASVCAGLVCSKIAGLTLGGQIAAGSYGRVYRGDFFGTKVAVKVLDGHAVLHRDEATGFCLEALLSEKLRHPNIIRSLAWAVVTGKGQLPAKKQLWGETLDPEKPSVVQNKITVTKHKQQQHQHLQDLPSPTAAAPAAAEDQNNPAYAFMQLEDCGYGSNSSNKGCVTSGVTNGDNVQSNSNVTAEDLEDDLGDDVSAGQTWMVMEYADKGCLQDAVERGWLRERPSCLTGALNLVAVLATAAEIASGMALLHEQGVIHGDLSAFNVMLSSADPAASIGNRGFVAKVADFGLSRSLTHKSKIITKTYGTITHMAPEVLEHGMVSKAADIYSFGVLMWQMVTGSRAWAGMSHMAVVNAVCCQKLQLQFPPDAPEGLVLLGQACMSFEPNDRPSFRDVLDILEPLNEIIVGKEDTVPAAAAVAAAALAEESQQQQPQPQQQQQQRPGILHGVESF